MSARLRHPLTAVAAAAFTTLPWLLASQVFGTDLGTLGTVAVSGLAVLGSSFLLAWAAESAEADVPRAFALAVLAVLAVAPEYAVDALYAWEAGANPGTPESTEAAGLAVANMTGANRILIGLGWSAIALFSIYSARQTHDPAVEEREGWLRDQVHLDPDISLEVTFLFAATTYAFFVPLSRSLWLLDLVVLVGMYALYILLTLRSPDTEETHVGVPAYFHARGKRLRVASVLVLFTFSGLVILSAVEPFAHGLESLGESIGVPKFLMIQWVAPLASESPELIVTAYLVNKARSTAAFNALISSKLNQWTLLIGTLVVVYSISLGYYDALPLGQKQMGEIWLTAAQSFFAVAVLVNLTISLREAAALLGLFALQLHPWFHHYEALLGFSAVYMVLGAVLLVRRRAAVATLLGRLRIRVFEPEAIGAAPAPGPETPGDPGSEPRPDADPERTD